MSDANHPVLAGSRIRSGKDKAARCFVRAGGMLVLLTLLLIFGYLLYVVVPLFHGASMTQARKLTLPEIKGDVLSLGVGANGQHLYRLSQQGQFDIIALAMGSPSSSLLTRQQLSFDGSHVTSSNSARDLAGVTAFGLADGRALLVSVKGRGGRYASSPSLTFPLGHQPVVIDPQQQPLRQIAVAASSEQLTVVAQTADYRLLVKHFAPANNAEFSPQQETIRPLAAPQQPADQLLLAPQQQRLFVRFGDTVVLYRLSTQGWERWQTLSFSDAAVSQIALLPGGSSLLVAQQNGKISQWFEVQQQQRRRFRRIREFQVPAPVTALIAEPHRRVFMTVSGNGDTRLFYATSAQRLLATRLPLTQPDYAGYDASRHHVLFMQGQQLFMYQVSNPYPEVSWHALWQRLWYEHYPQPDYIWQSTAADDDFEPKLSLTPLLFGTVKAAFYAMLFATPIALAAAVYTGYFMSGRLRNMVKPTVELMEAIPTVILGFLAGLWLAPIIEHRLPGVLLALLLVPAGVLGAAYGIHRLRLRRWLPTGGDVLYLVPVVIAMFYLAMVLSPWLEQSLMGGDSELFLRTQLGLDYDPRNALVVGLAMGFAVVPTIFTIAEDAIFNVPRSLAHGSLALGATQWQTLRSVVFLTASPGIFSAIMMGFGRAVGETMIVLMASGNTPVLSENIFTGMRTLAANIATEMPESTVGSAHYRVLFLSALVLLIFTFIVNSLAEMIRHRLRRHYHTL